MLNMYNSYSCDISNKSKIFEPFTLRPLAEFDINQPKVLIIANEKGFDINFINSFFI